MPASGGEDSAIYFGLVIQVFGFCRSTEGLELILAILRASSGVYTYTQHEYEAELERVKFTQYCWKT